jgi:hypothetical protein
LYTSSIPHVDSTIRIRKASCRCPGGRGGVIHNAKCGIRIVENVYTSMYTPYLHLGADGAETASGQALVMTTCRFYLSASAVSLVYKFVTPPQPWRRRGAYATFSDRHAALSPRPQAVSAGDCAPRAGSPSSRGLISVLSRPEIYPLDWPISFTSTEPDADDDVDSPVQRPGQASPVLAKVPGSTSVTLAITHFSLTRAAQTNCPRD